MRIYLVTSPLAFGYADDGFFVAVDTLRLETIPTSGFDDLTLQKNNDIFNYISYEMNKN